MANVLTDLAADIYKAADTVSRELVGFIPSVTLNTSDQGAALNDTIRSHVTNAATAGDNLPSMTIPEGTDQTVGNATMTISKSRGVPIPWTGEDIKSVNSGSGFETIYGDQIAQAMRTLCNEMEADIATAAYVASSRAYGTAGTTPFATAGNYEDASQTLKILKDNGAPQVGDRSLVMDTTAGAKFLGVQPRVDMQGSDSMLRQGVLLDTGGTMLRESGQAQTHTKGTGASYLVNNGAGYSVGDTTIAADTGTGTIIAGDVVTFAGDTNKYIVTTALSGGSFTIAEPGLKAALADNTAITVGNNYTANVMLTRSSFELAVRAPAVPMGGDAAVDRMIIVDPHSGLPFDISVYKGFQKMMINVGAAWGYKAWKPEHIATLLG